MGNTPKVALRHYLMTTDTHFDAAVRGDEKALQNALQQSHAMGGLEPRPHDPIKKETPVLQGLAGSCVLAQLPQMAGTGFEPVGKSSGNMGSDNQNGTESGTLNARFAGLDALIDSWGLCTADDRRRILAIVNGRLA